MTGSSRPMPLNGEASNVATAGWEIEATGTAKAFDRAETLLAVRTFMEPGFPYAIQALRSGRWEVVDPADEEGLLRVVEGFSDEAGVYYGLNPLRPGFVKPTKKGWNNPDVDHRVWFLVDVDPERPKNANATEAEKQEAWDVANEVIAYLTSRGWPPPIVVDSGNGVHLDWRIDLPNDKPSQQTLSGILKALRRFDTAGAKIDPTVHDAKRIAKLPGTWARKGPHSEERPHRLSKIIHIPSTVEVVGLDLLRREAGIKASPVEEPKPGANGWAIPETNGANGYAVKAFREEVGIVATCTSNRNRQLYESALKLGNFVGSGDLREDEVRAGLATAARAVQLGQDGDPEEIERAITNGLAAGKANPRTAPEKPPGAVKANAKPAKRGAEEDEGPYLKRASDYQTRRVKWLWPYRIPKGKLTTIAGGGGLGKSFVCCDLAARVSVGGEIPGMPGECFEVGKVIIINCEDDPEDTTIPRLIEAGADLDNIGIFRAEKLGRFTLADVEKLRAAVAEMGGVSLIIIDPATAFVGNTDDHKNAALQSLLGPLRTAAWDLDAAILLVTHVSKPGQGKVEAAVRVIGGVAWVNAVRAALIFTKDPDDKTKRLMIPFKTNNGPEVGGLRYSIQSTDTLARVQWEGVVDLSADDAMSSSSEREAAKAKSEAEIEAFLRGLFKETLTIPSQQGWDLTKAAGIPETKRETIRKRLGIQARRRKNEAGDLVWFWEAPAGFITEQGGQP